MATPVEIQIVVDAAQAGPAIDGVNQKLGEIGVKGAASVQQASGALDGGTQAMGRAGAAATQMGGHFATGLDSVRLVSQEFGMRMPRAIEAMLSRMPMVTSALSSMLGVMAGVAAVEIFTRVIEGAKEAYDKFFSLNAIIDKYNEGIEKARQADLPNARDIETLQMRLRDQTQAGALAHAQAQDQQNQAWADMSQPKKMDMLSGPLSPVYNAVTSVIDMHQAHQKGETADAADVARNELVLRKQVEATHELTQAQIELNHAHDASLVGAQKANAEAAKKIETSVEKTRYETAVEKSFGNEVAPGAGLVAQSIRDQTATAEANAQTTVFNRDMNLAIVKSNDARVQAGLQGEELYRRKMQDDIRETTLELSNQGKAAEIPAHTQEIMEKYFNDLSERAVKAQSALAGVYRQASLAGLTGAARIEGEHWNVVSENNTKYADNPGMQHAANLAASADANGKLLELQKQFSDQMDAISEAQTDATLGGYARIDAEATKASDHIREEFKKTWGGSDPLAFPLDGQNASAFAEAQKSEQGALDAVARGSAEKRPQLARQMSDETLRYDQQAAQAERRVKSDSLMGWVSDSKSAIAEINAQEEARVADLQKQYAKGDVDWDNYNQRLKDVYAETQAEIAEQNKQTQHAIASELEQAFSNPVDFIKRRMEQMMFEIVANWIMHLKMFQGVFGQTLGGLGNGGGASQSGGGILGAVFGGGLRGARGAAPASAGAGAGNAGTGGVAVPAAASGAAGSPSVASAHSAGGASVSSRSSAGIVSQIPSAAADVAQISHYRPEYTGGAAPGGSAGIASTPASMAAASHFASPSVSSAGSAGIVSQIPSAASDVAQIRQSRSETAGGAAAAAPGSPSDTGGMGTAGPSNPYDVPQVSGGRADISGGPTPIDGTSTSAPETNGPTAPDGTAPADTTPNIQNGLPGNSGGGKGIGGGLSPGGAVGAGSDAANAIGAAVTVGTAGYSAYQDTKADFKSGSAGGTLKGMLGDAGAGATIGSIIPGVGTLVGMAIGAAVGIGAGITGAIMGESGRIPARDYYKKSLLPEMEAERNSDGADWQTAISNVNRIASDGMVYINEHWGQSAAQYVEDNYLKKEQDFADAMIESRAKGGSYAVTMSASQFHAGGLISDFGSFGTGGDEGFVHAQLGEALMNPGAVSMHGPAIGAMNSGATPSDMARSYLANSASSGASSSTTNHNYGDVNVNTMDSKSFDRFLASGDNARTVVKHVNNYATSYAGDGIGG